MGATDVPFRGGAAPVTYAELASRNRNTSFDDHSVQPETTHRWTSAWPDLLGWALSLGVTWLVGWTTTDLVWSLWLSSLVVGYAMIVWTLVRPALELGLIAWQKRADMKQALATVSGSNLVIGAVAFVAIAAFTLGFFTFHFGGFHYVHSQFLMWLFPLEGHPRGNGANMAMYLEVAHRYWPALPSAFLAERSAFLLHPPRSEALSDTAVTAEAIARRKAAKARKPAGIGAPYAKVMRMHCLIIALGFLHSVRLESFWVFAAVYTVYFFPWRLVGRSAEDALTATPVLGTLYQARDPVGRSEVP